MVTEIKTKNKDIVWAIMWLAVLITTLIVISNCCGCSTMPLYRHVQLAEETRINLDLVAGAIADKVNDGTIKDDNADIIIEVYNQVADTQHLYVNAVKAFRKGTIGQTDLDARFDELAIITSDLAAELMVYGINIYKFVERIK